MQRQPVKKERALGKFHAWASAQGAQTALNEESLVSFICHIGREGESQEMINGTVDHLQQELADIKEEAMAYAQVSVRSRGL